MKQLTMQEMEELLAWVDQFELSRPRKKINRDFSDAVLVAEILKKLYPKLVDLHNYPSRNSYELKFDNWITLNRKVLKKLYLSLTVEMIQQLSVCHPGAIENLLHEIMIQFKMNSSKSQTNVSDDINNDLNSEIMLVNVQKKTSEGTIQTPQKMILYSVYEKLETVIGERDQAIVILKQKNDHLENLLNLKSERIQDLTSQLLKKTKNISIEQLEQFSSTNELFI